MAYFLYDYSNRRNINFFTLKEEKGLPEEGTTEQDNLPSTKMDEKASLHTEAEDWELKAAVPGSPLARRLEQQMREKKPYLHPQLTLPDLASQLFTNRTTLTRCLNQELGISFYDYVNRYRVAEACRLLAEAATRNESIAMTSVAQQSGFNSITSFNRYFGKLKGVTPLTYFRQLRCEQS
ncbi:MAG: helix-turn-helix domain-containing protein [Alloprevotella sp.]